MAGGRSAARSCHVPPPHSPQAWPWPSLPPSATAERSPLSDIKLTSGLSPRGTRCPRRRRRRRRDLWVRICISCPGYCQKNSPKPSSAGPFGHTLLCPKRAVPKGRRGECHAWVQPAVQRSEPNRAADLYFKKRKEKKVSCRRAALQRARDGSGWCHGTTSK